MKISILTIFPDFFPATLAEGMIRAAREKGRLAVEIHPWYGPKGIRSDYVLEPETKVTKETPPSR